MTSLNNINKNNPFKVPENYFEDFSKEIMSQLPEKETRNKVVPLWKKVVPWAAVAAMFVGIISTVGIFNNNSGLNPTSPKDATQQQAMLSETDEEDFYKYIQDEAAESIYIDALYSEVN
ncbi:negative regulator of sigma E activity [Dysgonomonas sp. PH5-45]|uniref:hypothetical protein n=1 Tax=unclassified Dysgonomonas TaxID=2630389 RepID=UPI0024748A28|nr:MULTISPECIES: hypothetical protein [unclassified Dysgonomonas]MDH6356093.1 negative regulator of sigma E activity [Dysgonomonas sp. PH5-45]MDH6388987.1 negative regulator of sigma E activity [Dysgonomonas sp. PH5-37]